MSTAKQRKVNTEKRGLLTEDITTAKDSKGKVEKAKPENPTWSKLIADHGGTNPFNGREFLNQVASGAAGFAPLKEWPKAPAEWRRGAGVTALRVAYSMAVPETLVRAWEEGQVPCFDNWRGSDNDEFAPYRLYGAFKSYVDAGPHPEPVAPAPVAPRPEPVVLMGEGFPRKELLDAAGVPHSLTLTELAGDGRFIKVVVGGFVPGIPVLEDVPSGAELKQLREENHYTPKRFAAVLNAEPSRILAWENEWATPVSADCPGGVSAVLRLYGTLRRIQELRTEGA